jgi:hypothetical protein
VRDRHAIGSLGDRRKIRDICASLGQPNWAASALISD